VSSENPATSGGASRANLEATAELLGRAQEGDAGARDILLSRYLPVLRHWARGRLPAGARSLSETDDMVQLTLMRAMGRLDAFEPRREGAFLSYLRRILINLIREELRRTQTRKNAEGGFVELAEGEGPLGGGAGGATLDAYEAALELLDERQREAIILRLEFGYSYPQIAEAVGIPSPDAARMMVKRSILRVAREMQAVRPAGAGPTPAAHDEARGSFATDGLDGGPDVRGSDP
jgi:RNA polymerase sigma-70 factor (ECF subfamily)